MVLVVVVGDAPTVKVPAPVAFPNAKVPVVVPGLPKVGVIVHPAAVAPVVLGTCPIAVLADNEVPFTFNTAVAPPFAAEVASPDKAMNVPDPAKAYQSAASAHPAVFLHA
jgi:hypothetical protein